MKEGTISVGGVTYVWELKKHSSRLSKSGLQLICNARPIGFIRDETDHSDMPGWYGEPDPDGVGTTFGPAANLESMIRRIIATHREIAHFLTDTVDAYAANPIADRFDVFEADTNTRIGRVMKISDDDWRAYLIDTPSAVDPFRAASLRAALQKLGHENSKS